MKIFIVLITAFFLSACGTKNNTQTPITPTPPQESKNITISPSKGQNKIENMVGLNTKDGQIVIKLYEKEAPNTTANFLKKVNDGFYNNLTFHRVIEGFMAQGGDPTGTGIGGNRQKSELNQIPFKRGSLGLARTADTKEFSNDSQFFICFTTEGCQHLTGDYVNFGEVVSGFDVLDKIVQGDKIISMTTDTK